MYMDEKNLRTITLDLKQAALHLMLIPLSNAIVFNKKVLLFERW